MKTIILAVQKHGPQGYGFFISNKDRTQYFDSNETVVVELPEDDKKSVVEKKFNKCGELIDKGIKAWLENQNLIPWEKGIPPKFSAEVSGKNKIRIIERV